VPTNKAGGGGARGYSVRYFGRTKKRERQKYFKIFTVLQLGHQPLRSCRSIGREPIGMYFDKNRSSKKIYRKDQTL
jgi:hypothetical protein